MPIWLAGRVDVDAVDAANPTGAEAFEMVFAFNFKRYIEKLGFSGAGNMFVWREVFDGVGDFRAGVAEDVDWGRRARLSLALRVGGESVASGAARLGRPEAQMASHAQRGLQRRQGEALRQIALDSPQLARSSFAVLSRDDRASIAQPQSLRSQIESDRRPVSPSLVAV